MSWDIHWHLYRIARLLPIHTPTLVISLLHNLPLFCLVTDVPVFVCVRLCCSIPYKLDIQSTLPCSHEARNFFTLAPPTRIRRVTLINTFFWTSVQIWQSSKEEAVDTNFLLKSRSVWTYHDSLELFGRSSFAWFDAFCFSWSVNRRNTRHLLLYHRSLKALVQCSKSFLLNQHKDSSRQNKSNCVYLCIIMTTFFSCLPAPSC